MTARMSAPCLVHRDHKPAVTYTELHHLIPQAWQVHWQPPAPWPYQGKSPDRPGVMLWDARTTAVCRTGHGNVHYWLVDFTRHLTVDRADDPAAQTAEWTAVRRDARLAHQQIVLADLAIAQQAVGRWVAAGGSLADLIAHQLWGEI